MKRRIALVSGGWGQNIGNAFFNVGGKFVLDSVFSDDRVQYFQDQPGYRTFNKQARGNPKNDVGLLKYLDVDVIVLQGPVFSKHFRRLWGETFKCLKRRGTKIILLSAAMFRYTNEEIEINRAFLAEIEPSILCTRDLPTYEAFKDMVPFSYAGIDSGFFAPEAYKPFSLTLPPFVAVNYDRFPEPWIRIVPENDALHGIFDSEFIALGFKWGLRYPKFLERLAGKGKLQSYFGNMLDWRRLPDKVDGFLIVRPEHRDNPHIGWKVYKHCNSFAWDEPFTYFTVYASSSLTLSDRVHACVATLAYGNAAMMYRHTRRAYLFDRLNLGDIGQRPVRVDQSVLEKEKRELLEFLKNSIQKLR